MIEIEAIGPAGDAIGLAALGEEIAMERISLGLGEDRLAPIAAPGNMMRDAGNGDASDARHDACCVKRNFLQLTSCHRIPEFWQP